MDAHQEQFKGATVVNSVRSIHLKDLMALLKVCLIISAGDLSTTSIIPELG